MPGPPVTLLTDFGTADAYVASMKGVILGLNPAAVLVDLTHEVPPQDIITGAFLLAEAAPCFPPGTIHLAVVDPGVGSARRGLAARCRSQFFVGPDNGLMHLIFRDQERQIVALDNPAWFRPKVAATFHGRDIFAPVAAHLSLGADLAALGSPVTDPVALEMAAPVFTVDTVRGQVLRVDHFGNLITNIEGKGLTAWLQGAAFRLRAGEVTLTRLAQTYADGTPGEILALIGSHDFVEIAAVQDHAARRLGAGMGLEVVIQKTVG